MSIHIDFETYSEVDLIKRGLWAYFRHPSTCILMMGYKIDAAPAAIWLPGTPLPREVLIALVQQPVRAFNAAFERAAFKMCGIKAGLPATAIPSDARYEDTQALAKACGLPHSLARCAAVLKLPERKDESGHELIRLFSIPQKDGRRIMPADRPHDFKRMVAYCIQDVEVDYAVHEALPMRSMPAYERKVWGVDAIVNERGICVDIPLCQGGASMAARAREQACSLLPAMTSGAVTTVGQNAKILAYCADNGYTLPCLEKPIVQEALEDESMPQCVRDVLELRADTNLTSLAKYAKVLSRVEDDGRVRSCYKYHAATTGRWGGQDVQFQNVPRPRYKLDDVDRMLIRQGDFDTLARLHANGMIALRDALRNMVIAKPGHVLSVVDSASIEARVLGWLANDPMYQQAYRNKEDLYKRFACMIFNKVIALILTDERFIGKESVLGLGYGMGWEAFTRNCINKSRDMFGEAIAMPVDLAQHVVRLYRSTFASIPRLWRDVEETAVRCVHNQSKCTLNTGTTVLAFHYVRGSLAIVLPSGRPLWYPEAKLQMRDNGYGRAKPVLTFGTPLGRNWVRNHTYGGKLVENLVQGIARDDMATCLVACEDEAFNPVLQTHDEVGCEVPDNLGDEVQTRMLEIFRTVPTWAPGLILDAAGFVSQYYKKG